MFKTPLKTLAQPKLPLLAARLVLEARVDPRAPGRPGEVLLRGLGQELLREVPAGPGIV